MKTLPKPPMPWQARMEAGGERERPELAVKFMQDEIVEWQIMYMEMYDAQMKHLETK